MYNYLISANPEEHELSSNTIVLANNETSKEEAISLLSRRWPLSIICVYSLDEMHKVTGKPTYTRYKRQPNGEIIPV